MVWPVFLGDNMNKFLEKFIDFKTLVFISAMFITGCAALFSVSGIGKLFAGAAVSAIVMASSLELGKIVSISFLYRYWNDINRALKWYLMTAAVVLMGITSAGIYGYLSAAYAKVAAEPLRLTTEMGTLESRASTLNSDIERKTTRLNQLISLRAQQENRLDQLISRSTTGNNSTIRSAQNQINQYDRDVTALQNDISRLSEERDNLLGQRSTKQIEVNTNSDIGTFVYIANVLGTDLDTVVKWFTLIIVLVFDPLAVALIIGFNFLVKKEENKEVTAPTSTEKEVWTVYGDVKEEHAPEEAIEEPNQYDVPQKELIINNIEESVVGGVPQSVEAPSVQMIGNKIVPPPANYSQTHRLS